jgi:hypothetical protein
MWIRLRELIVCFTIVCITDDAGAKEAADWAIARSLSELNRATETGKLQDVSADQLEAQNEETDTRGIRRAVKMYDDNEPMAASSFDDITLALGSRTRSIAPSKSAGSTIRRPLSTPRVSHCAITNSDDNEPSAASSCMYLFLLVLFGTANYKTIHKFASGFTVTC